MSLGEHMNEILCRWQGTDIRRRDRISGIWDIGWPWLFAVSRRKRHYAVAACRRELMATFVESAAPIFLRHPEPPQEYSVSGNWRPAGDATWLVPSEINLDDPAVKHWLFALGDWRLFQAPRLPATESPDAFRCSARDLVEWMSANSVLALIESFHDDAHWVVAVSMARY